MTSILVGTDAAVLGAGAFQRDELHRLVESKSNRSPIDCAHENGYRPSVRLRGGRRLRVRTNVTFTGAEGARTARFASQGLDLLD